MLIEASFQLHAVFGNQSNGSVDISYINLVFFIRQEDLPLTQNSITRC